MIYDRIQAYNEDTKPYYEVNIIETPNKKFIFVGSVPDELLLPIKENNKIIGYKDQVFDTVDDAIVAFNDYVNKKNEGL